MMTLSSIAYVLLADKISVLMLVCKECDNCMLLLA